MALAWEVAQRSFRYSLLSLSVFCCRNAKTQRHLLWTRLQGLNHQTHRWVTRVTGSTVWILWHVLHSQRLADKIRSSLKWKQKTLNFTNEKEAMHVSLHCSPHYVSHTSSSAALMPGFIERSLLMLKTHVHHCIQLFIWWEIASS